MIVSPSVQSSNQVRIERLCYGGRGVGGMPDGRVVFVPLVLPGELALIRPARQTKSYVEAELVEILEPAPSRLSAPCPHFGICGGCDWQHIPYELQLEAKHELLQQEVSLKLGI